jgi:hypothetical protein
MNQILKNPWFWGGTALIVFAYFTAKGSAQESGQGVHDGLVIVSIGAGAALIIYAVNNNRLPISIPKL